MDFVGMASIISSFLATFGGIVISGKLTSYRIEQLEKKVEKLADINEKVILMDEKIKVVHHRLDDMENELKAHARSSAH